MTREPLDGPLEPLSDNPVFLVHAWALDGTKRRCGATDGRMTARREAIECPRCWEIVNGGQ